MRCHYEVLEVAADVSSADLKKKYRKLALKLHPDKNGSTPEATEIFQELQNAYETLADPHERKWYDDHREQILNGSDPDDANSDEHVNLFKYFSSSVYSGYQDDDKGFYTVYGNLFHELSEREQKIDANFNPPGFGTSKSPVEEVNEFYNFWRCFVTVRNFSWCDVYNTTEAPTRHVRRAMEKENKKKRDAQKKEYNAEVRTLVDYIRKRDKRWIKHQAQIEKQKNEQLLQDSIEKEKKAKEFLELKKEFERQQLEMWKAEEVEKKSSSNGVGSRLADKDIEEELERQRKKEEAPMFLCAICDSKNFKSEKQLLNHMNSKKHKENARKFFLENDDGKYDEEFNKNVDSLGGPKVEKTISEAPGSSDNNLIEVDSETEKLVLEEERNRQEEVEDLLRIRKEKEEKSALRRMERKEKRKQDSKKKVNQPTAQKTVSNSTRKIKIVCFECEVEFKAPSQLAKHIKKTGHQQEGI